VSDQIAEAKSAHERELASILDDLARLRQQTALRRIKGHVLPNGDVMLESGEIVDGIKGAPDIARATPVHLPITGNHVQGAVLPDGTVMAGDKIVDGVHGAPMAPVPIGLEPTAKQLKDLEQDHALKDLEEKGGWS
jgi:hypothetical protein